MIHRYYEGRVPVVGARATVAGASAAGGPAAAALDAAVRNAPDLIAAALEDFDFRRATEAVWRIADEANRYVNRTRPWDLAKAGDRTELDAVLAVLLVACQATGTHLASFLPDAAARITLARSSGIRSRRSFRCGRKLDRHRGISCGCA